MRLDRLLANLGYGSRTEVKQLIADGRVERSDGTRLTDPGRATTPEQVLVDGEPLDHPGPLLVMLHKPIGYVCSHDEREGLRAYDLLPYQWLLRNPRLESIGRLDKDSTGLLLFTDDHQLVHRLTSPKHHLPKRYTVTLDTPADAGVVERFASGDMLIDGDTTSCRPAELILGVEGNGAEVVMYEGRYRQVRRMFAACDRTVLTLHRTDMGPYALGALGIGEHTMVPFAAMADGIGTHRIGQRTPFAGQ